MGAFLKLDRPHCSGLTFHRSELPPKEYPMHPSSNMPEACQRVVQERNEQPEACSVDGGTFVRLTGLGLAYGRLPFCHRPPVNFSTDLERPFLRHPCARSRLLIFSPPSQLFHFPLQTSTLARRWDPKSRYSTASHLASTSVVFPSPDQGEKSRTQWLERCGLHFVTFRPVLLSYFYGQKNPSSMVKIDIPCATRK